MNYNNGSRGPFNNGQPFANPPMFPHMIGSFPQRGPPFRHPMMRGMPRRGGPPGRMMRPGFRPERPHMRPHQPRMCPPYMMNRPISTPQQRYTNVYHSTENEFNGQQNIPERYGQCNDLIGEIENEEEDGSIDNSGQESNISEHKVCGLDGCTFTAHVKIIEKHIEMHHTTGIFKRLGNLDSPENIAKWIEERKARFPHKGNEEKKQKHQEELWKKGIRIGERKNKLGKDKTKLVRKDFQTRKTERDNFFKKRQEKREKVIKKLKPKLLIDDKSDWNGNLPPFRGIIELFGDKEEEKCMISDDEDDYNKRPTKFEDLVKVNSSLGALMAYASDYSEDDDELPNNDVKNEKKNTENQICEKELVSASEKKENVQDNPVDSDGEGPLEMKIEKTTTLTENDKHEELREKTRKRKSNNKSKNQKACKKTKTENFPQQFHTRKISHLEKILDEDIRKERNIILQCVRHTVENNFYTNS